MIQQQNAKDGWIYFAQASTGHIKIGKSRSPVERVKHFDTIMPIEVEMLHYFYADDTNAAEKELHGMFSFDRERGEWFLMCQEKIDWLYNIHCYLEGELYYTPAWMTGDLRCLLHEGIVALTEAELPY